MEVEQKRLSFAEERTSFSNHVTPGGMHSLGQNSEAKRLSIGPW